MKYDDVIEKLKESEHKPAGKDLLFYFLLINCTLLAGLGALALAYLSGACR